MEFCHKIGFKLTETQANGIFDMAREKLGSKQDELDEEMF